MLPPSRWPQQPGLTPEESDIASMEICHTSVTQEVESLIPLDCYSSYLKLIRITAWAIRFVTRCRTPNGNVNSTSSALTIQEIDGAELYWLSHSQSLCFSSEFEALKKKKLISTTSKLFRLHPFLDSKGLLRVSGRGQRANLAFSVIHPVILSGKHQLTKLIIRFEHRRLLHAGPTLLSSSLSEKYHIIGG